MSGSLTGAASTVRGLKRTNEKYQEGRAAGVQEQREDKESED